jgi:integrase
LGPQDPVGLKFALVSMLRSGELLPIHRGELNAANGTVDIPARRVKKRRVFSQPLSELAQGVLQEAMGNHEHAFAGRSGKAPLSRQVHVWRAARHHEQARQR